MIKSVFLKNFFFNLLMALDAQTFSDWEMLQISWDFRFRVYVYYPLPYKRHYQALLLILKQSSFCNWQYENPM